MKKTIALVLLGILALPALASAQNKPTRSSDDCAKQRKHNKGKCELAIEPELIEKDTARPTGETGEGRPDAKHPGLIRLRTDFTDRIVASAEQR